MSDSIIQQLQKDITLVEYSYNQIIHNQDNIFISLFVFLIVLVIAIVYISYAAFIKGRDAEKGKIEGRLESLDLLVKEQEKITNTVEVIKNDIEKGVWLEKERNSVKRQKIEEMMSCLSDVNKHLYEKLNSIVKRDSKTNNNDPLSRLLDIEALYFEPNEIEGIMIYYELQNEIAEILQEYVNNNLAHFNKTHQYLVPDSDFVKRYGNIMGKNPDEKAKFRSFLGKKMRSLLDE